MGKKTYGFLVVIGLVCVSLIIYFVFPKPVCTLSSLDKRAVWISYENLSKFSYESKEAFSEDFNQAIRLITQYKNNTVIVHVRAFADAMYESKLFPVSQYITQKDKLSFDPLSTMIEIAHQNGLNFEAWINPYRISLNQKSYEQFQKHSPNKKWLEDESKVINYGEYKYIFNPSSKEVRDYIVQGVEEIVKDYEVDAIHFDDYFYVPGTHGSTSQNERFDNVNMLIGDVYQSIKKINKGVQFGISPQGNYENCMAEGADIDTWLKEEGYIDYLLPQIYWSDQYGKDGQTTMFTDRIKVFSSLKKRKEISLYAGLALYQSGNKLELDQGWSGSSSNISDQVQILSIHGYDGFSLFDYTSLESEAAKKEMDQLLKVHPYS